MLVCHEIPLQHCHMEANEEGGQTCENVTDCIMELYEYINPINMQGDFTYVYMCGFTYMHITYLILCFSCRFGEMVT